MTTAAIIDEERLAAGVVVSCPAFGLSPSFSNRCANQTPNFCAEFRPAQELRAGLSSAAPLARLGVNGLAGS